MKQPLVTRPPYGKGRARDPVAVAELPQGGPATKGLPLNESIPGDKTFAQPENNDTGHSPARDESIYRIRDPRDMTKDQSRQDQIDHSEADPHYFGLGKPTDNLPYRRPSNIARVVAALWELRGAPVRVIGPQDKVRLASTVEEVLNNLSHKFQQRAKKCKATLTRADIKNLRWLFSVDCGNGPKVVSVKARRSGNVTKFSKLDLELSCSCPAWRWQGPEYHAKEKKYQLGKPRGTASPPDIRDPDRIHPVCKHVAAALALTKDWTIPKKQMKKKRK